MKHSLLKAFLALMLAVLSVCSLAACGTGESGNTPCTTCEDKDENHLCDTCKKELSTCKDADKNHKCDLCKKVLSTCKDASKDHKCDLCSVSLGTCGDTDKDHRCDLCSASIGNHAAAADSHLCTYCGKAASTCADADKNHLCDTCSTALSVCEDKTKDHKCDICSAATSECGDKDDDGLCDTCGKEFGDKDSALPSAFKIDDLSTMETIPAGVLTVAADGYLHIRVHFDQPAKDAYFELDGQTFYTYNYNTADNTCDYEICFPVSDDHQFFTLNLKYEEAVIATYECTVDPVRFYGIYTDIAHLDPSNPPSTVEDLPAGTEATLFIAMNAPLLPTYLSTLEMGTLPVSETPWVVSDDGTVYFYTVTIPADMLLPFGSEDGGSRTLIFEILTQENAPSILASYTVNFITQSEPPAGEEPVPGGSQTGGMIAILDVYNEVTQSSVPTNENLFFGYGDGKICITVRLNRNVESIYFENDEMMCTGEASGTEGEYYFTIGFPPAAYERMGELKLCVYENETQTTIGHYSYLVAAAEFYGIYTDPSQLNTQTKPSGVTVPCGETAVIYIATTAISVDPTELYIARGDDNIHLEFCYNPWDNEPAYIDHDAGFSLPIGFYRVEIPADLMELGEGETFGTHKIAFVSERDGEKIWATYTVNFSR